MRRAESGPAGRWRPGVVIVTAVALVISGLGLQSYRKGRHLRKTDDVARTAAVEGMPILGYALARDGINYVAYLRWVQARFPAAGEQYLTEVRVRFS
ncbi:MAG: hypothetical protein J2P46_08570, partial [Zavarzinella sp.]|nr:hypothetical protein [Zavarzinella sp.]